MRLSVENVRNMLVHQVESGPQDGWTATEEDAERQHGQNDAHRHLQQKQAGAQTSSTECPLLKCPRLPNQL